MQIQQERIRRSNVLSWNTSFKIPFPHCFFFFWQRSTSQKHDLWHAEKGTGWRAREMLGNKVNIPHSTFISSFWSFLLQELKKFIALTPTCSTSKVTEHLLLCMFSVQLRSSNSRFFKATDQDFHNLYKDRISRGDEPHIFHMLKHRINHTLEVSTQNIVSLDNWFRQCA